MIIYVSMPFSQGQTVNSPLEAWLSLLRGTDPSAQFPLRAGLGIILVKVENTAGAQNKRASPASYRRQAVFHLVHMMTAK